MRNNMQAITSEQNPRIKRMVKLQKRRHREKTQEMAVEGLRLVEETLAGGFLLEVFFDEDLVWNDREKSLLEAIVQRGLPAWSVNHRLLQKMCQTQTPAGILGLSSIPAWQDLKEPLAANAFVLLADAIQDPGNLGTMIRTGAAAGASAVIIGQDCVDPWNPKTVRASMGAVFRVPLATGSRKDILNVLEQRRFSIIAADIQGAVPYYKATLKNRIAIAIGSEAEGLHESFVKASQTRVFLPMDRGVESLNAATAAAVLLYECRRQRDCHCQSSPPVL